MMKNPVHSAPRLAVCCALGLAFATSGCFLQHQANTNPLAAVKSNQPDKALFDAAMADMDKGKYTVARLSLETLLNAYPDSEYLARAKMGIADSWYREGGIEGMAQAEAQYKDFITFFPQMKEASEAQLKVATIHYRDLQKPDRDPTEANRAQAELRTFLINYGDSPLRSQAVQMLRDTQEVLAEREYRIAHFYLDRAAGGEYPDYRPGQNRLEEMLEKYPLYSQGDVALDELANSYLLTSRRYADASKLESSPQSRDLYQANADADCAKAVEDFTKLVERYPVSPEAKDAQRHLTALKAPAPKPTEEAIAFNRQEIAGRTTAAAKKSSGMVGGLASRLDLTGLVSTHPEQEIARADKVGAPSLTEPQLAEDLPPPGLDALIRQTMIATGALPAQPNATLGAKIISGEPAVPAPPTPTAAVQPLAFQNVPDKPQGADTQASPSPQAITGSNANDPNARHAASNANPNLILTPNEIDLQNREQILAAEVHRDVPAPSAELKRNLAQSAKLQAAADAKLKRQQKGKPPVATTTDSNQPTATRAAATSNDTATAAAASAAPKKGFFHRIWPR
jgi:outer membrane protein assembly factor BamD